MELGPSDVLGCAHHPLQQHMIEGSTIAIPGSEAASKNALNGTAVKPFQTSEGEEVLSRLLHNWAHVFGPF